MIVEEIALNRSPERPATKSRLATISLALIGAFLITAQQCQEIAGSTGRSIPAIATQAPSASARQVFFTEEEARGLLSLPSSFFAPLPLVPDPADSGSRPISEWYALPWIQARFEASGVRFIQRNAFAADRACVTVCALFVYAQGFLDDAGALTGLSLSQEYEASSPQFVGLSPVMLPPGVSGYSLRLRLPVGAEMLTFGTAQHNLMIGGQVLALSGQDLAAIEVRDRALRFILGSVQDRSPTR